MANISTTEIFWAFTGGLLPVLLWLWFWLREDSHPEPRRMIMIVFTGGMIMAIVSLFLEQFAQFIIAKSPIAIPKSLNFLALLAIWAAIEETAKYSAAKRGLRSREFDEPVDALIYLITAALGFAAMENILFLLKILNTQGMIVAAITTNLRFFGATLLHVIASATIGASIAFSFFHKEKMHRNIFGGLAIATTLHTLFNFFIIKSGGANIFKILIPLWFAIIILILIFEKIKGLKNTSN